MNFNKHEVDVIRTAFENLIKDIDSDVRKCHSIAVGDYNGVLYSASWQPYDSNSYHMLYSLSKTFVAIAIGIASGEGLLSLKTPITDIFRAYLPDEFDEGYDEMTIEHLLMMSTGQENDPTFSMQGFSDWRTGFFMEKIIYAPGSAFMYNSAATYMLSAVISEISGMDVNEYLKDRLFRHIGISDSWWQKDPRGICTGGWGLYLRLTDICKFAQLMLNDGVHDGKRIIPAGFIGEMTSRKIDSIGFTRDWISGYGYQMWIGSEQSVRGDGAFGQFCVLFPQQNFYVVALNGLDDMQGFLDKIYNNMTPAFNEGSSYSGNRGYLHNYMMCYKPLEGIRPGNEILSDFNGKYVGNIGSDVDIVQIDLCCENEDIKLNMTISSNGRGHSCFAESGRWTMGNVELKRELGGPVYLGGDTDIEYPTFRSYASYGFISEEEMQFQLRYNDSPLVDEWTFRKTDDGMMVLRNLTGAFDFSERRFIFMKRV